LAWYLNISVVGRSKMGIGEYGESGVDVLPSVLLMMMTAESEQEEEEEEEETVSPEAVLVHEESWWSVLVP
jgi:hypothetical protein